MITYVVRFGDTLSEIAERFGTSVEAIAEANGIEDPDFIFVGQILLVPDHSSGGPGAPMQIYVVRPGDTLGEIAERFGTTVDAFVRANRGLNGIEDPDLIFPGQRLLVPI